MRLWKRERKQVHRPERLSPRERVWRAIKHQPVDQVPCVDVYFLPETIKRWEKEGLPEGISIPEFFDLDLVCLPVDCTAGLKEKLLDETDEYRIVTGADGVTRKHWKVYAAAPQELDFPIKQYRDWREIRPMLRAHEVRLPENFEIQISHAHERERFIALSFLEPCTLARKLLGSRQWVEFMQTQNPMLDEILETGVRLILDTVELAFKRLSKFGQKSFDGVWLHADLSYTHAAFMTDKEYRSIILPYHRQLVSELRRHSLAVLLYTQGNSLTFLNFVRKSGFDAILPLECISRNELAEYKRTYGQQTALGGNISVDKLMESDEMAESEVKAKVKIGLGENFTGYMFCLDRPVPPSLPLSRYEKALSIARSTN
ncbi:MAG: uroporphyrinogen decarboxylase family protein [Armatimonadetes bacterium]|nr:uroporphyrinogen decarboxylase family protein [Armatimonadota bacterium]MDW8027226.1 uroporphyrinogen decarboxylase family protein [Armatimonadota bacterium]